MVIIALLLEIYCILKIHCFLTVVLSVWKLSGWAFFFFFKAIVQAVSKALNLLSF